MGQTFAQDLSKLNFVGLKGAVVQGADNLLYFSDGLKWMPFKGEQGVQGIQGASGGITLNVTDSGSGAYLINGALNPTIFFIRGQRYIINVDAPGHPFFIQTGEGAYNPGTIYTTGITNNGTQNGTIVIEVAFNAPAQLYYVCRFHTSMAGVMQVSDLGPTGATGAPPPFELDLASEYATAKLQA